MPAKVAVKVLQFDEDKNTVRPFQFTLDGRRAFSRPVINRPYATKRGPTKQRKPLEARRSMRRFHGLRVIEIARGGAPT
jgi:hypothetical protein